MAGGFEAAELPIGGDEQIHQEALFDGGWLPAAVVLGGECGKIVVRVRKKVTGANDGGRREVRFARASPIWRPAVPAVVGNRKERSHGIDSMVRGEQASGAGQSCLNI